MSKVGGGQQAQPTQQTPQQQQQQQHAHRTCILYPSSNEVVYRETDCMIVWEYSAADSPMAPPAVDIELQRAKDGTPVRTIAQRVRNQGSFFWSVSQNVPTGGPFRLFVGNMFLSSPHEASAQKNGPNAIYSAPFFIKKDTDSIALLIPPTTSTTTATTSNGSAAKKVTSVIDSLSLDDAMATLSLDDAKEAADAIGVRKKTNSIASENKVATAEKLCGKKRDCHSMVVTTSEDDSEPPSIATSSTMTFTATVKKPSKVLKPAKSVVLGGATPSAVASLTPLDASAGTIAAAGTTSGKKRGPRVRAAGTTGASSFALDASGSGGGGGYTAASSNNNSLTDQDKEQLCAYIYSRVQIPASAVRRNLKEIVADNNITPDTVLSTGMRAGHFCVYYLLQRYYKKQLARSNATLERQIEKENHRTSDVGDRLKAFLKVPKSFRGDGNASQRPSPPLPAPSRVGNAVRSNSSTNAAPPVLFGGDGEQSGNNSGSGSGEREDVLFCRDDWSLSNSSNGAMIRKEMSACVEGVSIRLEREYLQRIRCWSLNVDRDTLVDIELQLTAEQFALQYVQTDRRKRIENTRRSKDRRKQREDGETATVDDNDSDDGAMDCDGAEDQEAVVAPQSAPPPHLANIANVVADASASTTTLATSRAGRKPQLLAAEKKPMGEEVKLRRSTRHAQ